jgi:hypothetical protein
MIRRLFREDFMNKIVIYIFLIFFLSIADSASSQIRNKRSTNPNPPKIKIDPISMINLGTEVPSPPDKYTYVVSGKIGGFEVYKDKVPLWELHGSLGRIQIGEVPVGSTIKLENINKYAGTTYYGVPLTKKIGNVDLNYYGWLEGSCVSITGINTAPNSPTR